MVDVFDRAQALEQRERDQVLQAHLQRTRAAGPSLTHCEECDEEIPAARQALGVMTRCVPCQSIFEKRIQR